jgi:hypothetical protein
MPGRGGGEQSRSKSRRRRRRACSNPSGPRWTLAHPPCPMRRRGAKAHRCELDWELSGGFPLPPLLFSGSVYRLLHAPGGSYQPLSFARKQRWTWLDSGHCQVAKQGDEEDPNGYSARVCHGRSPACETLLGQRARLFLTPPAASSRMMKTLSPFALLLLAFTGTQAQSIVAGTLPDGPTSQGSCSATTVSVRTTQASHLVDSVLSHSLLPFSAQTERSAPGMTSL